MLQVNWLEVGTPSPGHTSTWPTYMGNVWAPNLKQLIYYWHPRPNNALICSAYLVIHSYSLFLISLFGVFHCLSTRGITRMTITIRSYTVGLSLIGWLPPSPSLLQPSLSSPEQLLQQSGAYCFPRTCPMPRSRRARGRPRRRRHMAIRCHSEFCCKQGSGRGEVGLVVDLVG